MAVKNLLPDNLFPERVKDLLHAISGVGFFERSVVIGSWVMPIVNDERMRRVIQGQRFSKETRRHIASSCEVIGFPLHRIGLL